MRSRTACLAFLAALVAGGFSLGQAMAQTGPPAAAKPVTRKSPPRPPARVTVQKRSFLDAGTEVLPGQRKFTDYAYPPGYSPTQVIDYTTLNIRGPRGGLWVDPFPPSGRPFGW